MSSYKVPKSVHAATIAPTYFKRISKLAALAQSQKSVGLHPYPYGIVDGGDLATVPRVGNFGNQKGACSVGNIGSESNEESANEIHDVSIAILRSKGLQKGPEDDEKAPYSGTDPSTEAIGNIWGEQKDKETAKTWHGAEDTESATRRVDKN